MFRAIRGHDWTTANQQVAQLTDAVNSIRWAVLQVASAPKKVPQPKPTWRPGQEEVSIGRVPVERREDAIAYLASLQPKSEEG